VIDTHAKETELIQAMTHLAQHPFTRSSIELLLQENKLVEALELIRQSTSEGLPERETHLYALLARARLHGPEPHEADIDALRSLSELNEREKEMVRRIFLYAFQVAERFGQEEKKWAYQRLLRKLLLGQPLNQPIPITPNMPPAPHRVIRLEPAAMISTPAETTVVRNRNDARIRSWERTVRRSVLELCAMCLLGVPLAYVASRTVPAPMQRSAAPTPSAPASMAATAESGTHGMSTKEEKEKFERFDEEQIKDRLSNQLTGLRRAYARWATKKGDITGSVALKLTVDGNGQVVAVNEVASQLPDAGFLKVVMAEARKWRFAVGNAELGEVTIPLLFIPKGSDARALAGPQRTARPERTGPVEKPPVVRIAKTMSESTFPKFEAEAPQETIAVNAYNAIEQPEELQLDYVAQRPIALHEEPRFASSTLEEIDGGTRIAVVAVQGDWFKVRTARSRSAGFVRKEFVVPVSFTR
jgi:hypothetical protein